MDADTWRGEAPEPPTDHQVDVAVRTFQLLGDGTRLRIVWALLHGEYSVGELAALVGAQPAAVSQHLAKLRLTRLVRTRRQGTRIFYVAENVHVGQLLWEALYHADHVAQDLPDHEPTA
jgi:ArsR family transcriptional regulator, zinc-responsive transcriptional repressor